MTNPIPGADSELTVLDKELMPKRAAFLEFCKTRALDVTERKDAWGNRTFVQSHVEAMWYGWFNAPAAKVGANVAADIPTWQEREKAFRARVEDGGPVRITYMKEEIAALRAAIAAGAPVETPKPATERLAEKMQEMGVTIRSYSPGTDPNATAEQIAAEMLKALEQVAAKPAPIAGDVEKDAAWQFLRTHSDKLHDALSIAMGEASGASQVDYWANIANQLDAAMLANSSSGEAG